MSGNPMTPTDLAFLGTYWRAGLTYKQIADKMGRSRNSIAGYCHRLGLKHKEPAPCPAPLTNPSVESPSTSSKPIASG
jgi:hypothetical protein